ncbi:hypothetical protein KP509_19G012800 [Ceratopteris richardii]|uniref:NPH3 domain-containing protein n=1 Tax=Ceratopteris richardii TaxID=49495 RepID=A0A8T2SJU7_CERRI|nr:hypothetical protein KP509_19G012800 [Ceratopteris richardii]KAH7351742.1 hypothetical protein KP509_19G012800 [Ceratopteris richardii]
METQASYRRNLNSGFPAKRDNSSGIFPDVESDLVICVDGVNFYLHKYPLLSRCGRLRKHAEDINQSVSFAEPSLEFTKFPGGPDCFELAAKFCYGISFDITVSNVAHLRCAAEFLEMSENYGEDNLILRTDSFLEQSVLDSVEKSAKVLHACEDVMAWAEDGRIITRCIDAVASKVRKEQMAYGFTRFDYTSSHRVNKFDSDTSSPLNGHRSGLHCKATVEWWADHLSPLRIDLYQRVLAAMKSRGVRIESIGGSLMHYAQKVLLQFRTKKQQTEDDDDVTRTKAKILAYSLINSKAMEHEQRILLERIVGLLPGDANLFPINFLLSLLRIAITLDSTVACQLDLQKRASAQLEWASVDDLLIPNISNAGESLFDVEIVHRVLATYLENEEVQDRASSTGAYDTDDHASLNRAGLTKIGKLFDMYLAEIAPDANLKVSKFLSIAELLPDYSRVNDDGLYRAIDIFLKAHPNTSESDRKKLCKLLDCQKMSQEACAHAAQNERLPVQMIVQVLYFEQLRMRTEMVGSTAEEEGQRRQSPSRAGNGKGGELVFYGNPQRRVSEAEGEKPVTSRRQTSPTMSLRSADNGDLALEVARLRIRVNDLEKENARLKQQLGQGHLVTSGNMGFFSFFSRGLGKMGLFSTGSKSGRSSKKQQKDSKTEARFRRHSIS